MKRLALLFVAASVAAQDAKLADVAGKLGVEFREASPGVFAATLTKDLATCDRIDLEVRGGEVTAYPRIKGQRLDPRRCADREGLLARLGAESPGIAPLKWAADAEGPIRAVATGEVERALLAAPALDKAVADLLPALTPSLSDEEVNAKLREASTAEEAKRNEILASVVAYLPEMTPCTTPGQAAFEKVVMNGRGIAFDAVRFRVLATEGEHRLVWGFAIPPGTLKGWYIAPVGGDAPKFVKFHRGGKYEGMPEGHASVLQRSETPLKAGAEYILWFQFKVETPVEMHVALGCFPYVESDRDAQAVLEAALGLKTVN